MIRTVPSLPGPLAAPSVTVMFKGDNDPYWRVLANPRSYRVRSQQGHQVYMFSTSERIAATSGQAIIEMNYAGSTDLRYVLRVNAQCWPERRNEFKIEMTSLPSKTPTLGKALKPWAIVTPHHLAFTINARTRQSLLRQLDVTEAPVFTPIEFEFEEDVELLTELETQENLAAENTELFEPENPTLEMPISSAPFIALTPIALAEITQQNIALEPIVTSTTPTPEEEDDGTGFSPSEMIRILNAAADPTDPLHPLLREVKRNLRKRDKPVSR